MKTKKVTFVKSRFENEGLRLEVSHNGWQTTSIGPFDIEDLKKLRKVIRKAIKDMENENH